MANGRVTNIVIYEKLEVLTQQMANVDQRLTALHEDVSLVTNHLHDQIGILKKKSGCWRLTRPLWLFRLLD